ncbi:MAG: lipoprotein NlpD [Janthinobacterium sp.]|jgi:lipoprotein NlpD
MLRRRLVRTTDTFKNMYKKRPLLLLFLSLGFLSACSTTSQLAPVVDRAGSYASAAPNLPGMYTVRKGDTLYRIALEHGQSHHDLVAWNRLIDPNDIKVDQVLRVVPLPDAEVASGAQTLAVTMPPNTSAADASVPRKTMPRGDKRPYSEAPLAESRRPDGGVKSDASASGVVRPAVVVRPDDEALSWIWPSAGKVVGTFDDGKNKGIDIAGKAGQQVIAAGAGKVMYAGSGIRGYGNLVIIKHSNSLLSAYAHNRSIVVKEGQSVGKGQMIAEMGDSDSDSVKLHFEIRQQGKPVDPAKFLPVR